MIKLKDILKEASGNQMTFGEYGYSVKSLLVYCFVTAGKKLRTKSVSCDLLLERKSILSIDLSDIDTPKPGSE